MLLNKKEKSYRPALSEIWLQKLRRLIYRSKAYQLTLKKKPHLDIKVSSGVSFSQDADAAQKIIKDQFVFSGRVYEKGASPWQASPQNLPWQRYIHSHAWLADLCQQGTAEALIKARQLVSNWMEQNALWSDPAWRADVVADRLVMWMVFQRHLTQSADETFVKGFYTSFSMQASHLARSFCRGLKGLDLLRALRGKLYLALFVAGFDRGRDKVLLALSEQLDQQILADGGHISRSPSDLLETLAFALEVKAVLDAEKIEVPDGVHRAIDRMAPMVRTLRHADGALALFHGAQEEDKQQIDALLEQTGNQGSALSDARHSGYQRIEAGQTVLIMDVAAPPSLDVQAHGHAAPLSFEFSCGDERVLVNCGAMIGGEASWQDALAATAAHNTLTVDDKNCLHLRAGGGIIPREIEVSSKRFEENGEVLIDARHDAYRETFGLIHERSVYVNKVGTDIRFEDKLVGTGGDHFAISLHLHPDVQASIVNEGQAALLKLPSGTGWHLRVQGGKLDMRDSIFVGSSSQIRQTDQIVIQGPLRGDGCDVKWRLSRIGGL